MHFACIFVPDFPMEAILRAEPELRSQAVAVLEGKPPLQKIIALNENAQTAGVSIGMTKLHVEGLPEIILRDRSAAQESAAHAALLDCAQSFSPRVEDVAPDMVLLDASGLEKLFGPVHTLARDISRRANGIGLQANVALAQTIEAALLAARGFDGITVVPNGKEQEILGSLPVEVLLADIEKQPSVSQPALSEVEGCLRSEDVLEILHRWGIRKFRDLAALPEAALTERLGQHGLALQRRARGMGNRTLVPCEPSPNFEEFMELEFPLVLLEPLSFLLNRMLEQLCARLEARALAAQELQLELTLDNGRQKDSVDALFQRTIQLPIPMLNAKTFLKLLQLDLIAHPPGAPILKVHLRINPAKPRPVQDGFFIPASPQAEKLELTLARINAVVGEGRAGSPQMLDTHRPQAFEMRRFFPSDSARARTPAPPKSTRRGGAGVPARANENYSSNTAANLVTALRIFRPPIAVTVIQQNGQPSHISSQKRNQMQGEVLWAAGPWRSSGDWWDRDAWMRDEWDIALQEKTGIVLYRLVHDLIEGKWMLEGSYD